MAGFLVQVGFDGFEVSSTPWGMWNATFPLHDVRDGVIAPALGSEREVRKWIDEALGSTEKAMFSRMSRAARLRTWAGDVGVWGGLILVVLPVYGYVDIGDGRLSRSLVGSGVCSAACASALGGGVAIGLVAGLVVWYLFVRAVSCRMRRQWVEESTSDWQLLAVGSR